MVRSSRLSWITQTILKHVHIYTNMYNEQTNLDFNQSTVLKRLLTAHLYVQHMQAHEFMRYNKYQQQKTLKNKSILVSGYTVMYLCKSSPGSEFLVSGYTVMYLCRSSPGSEFLKFIAVKQLLIIIPRAAVLPYIFYMNEQSITLQVFSNGTQT